MRVDWKKAALITADLILAGYLAVALTVFNKPDESKTLCTKVTIDVADSSTSGFIDAREVKRRIAAHHLNPMGQPLTKVSARDIEDMLRRSPFINTAECYKTIGGEVHITVTQRMPVIRIKADDGSDYYVDNQDSIMPNSSFTSDLIIATGRFGKRFATEYIAPLGRTLMANALWRNLIEQIHVTEAYGIEIVPRVGDHIVYLGTLPEYKDDDTRNKAIEAFVKRKMTRLVKFYRYGLSHAGWNRYDYIDLEFDNQIICRRDKEGRAEAPEPQPTETDEVAPPPTPAEKPSETPKAEDKAPKPKAEDKAPKPKAETPKPKDKTTKPKTEAPKSKADKPKETKKEKKETDTKKKKETSPKEKTTDSKKKTTDSKKKNADKTKDKTKNKTKS